MKKLVKSAVCAFVLTFAVSAFAGEGKLTLDKEAKINGTVVKPGTYKVKWDEAGSVSVLSGKKVVASANARVNQSQTKAAYNAAVTVKDSDGTNKLIEVQFSGKKDVLVLSDGSAGAN